MKSVRNRVLSVMIILVGTNVLFSQPVRMTVEERTDNLKELLTLTDDQTQKVTSILKESEKRREALRGESSDDRQAIREKMIVLMDDTDKKINALLTSEQRKKYEKLKKDRRQSIEERRERRE